MIKPAQSRSDNMATALPSRAFIQIYTATHDDSEPALIGVGELVGMAPRDLRINLSQALKLGGIHDIAIETEGDLEPIFLSCELSRQSRSAEDPRWLLQFHILNAIDTDLQRWDALIGRYKR